MEVRTPRREVMEWSANGWRHGTVETGESRARHALSGRAYASTFRVSQGLGSHLLPPPPGAQEVARNTKCIS